MWMGETITQRGIGNGMSLIIFASVVSSLPGTGTQVKAEDGWGGAQHRPAHGGADADRSSCSSSRASVASRCSSPSGWSVAGCTAARTATSRSRSTRRASSRSSSPTPCSTCRCCSARCCRRRLGQEPVRASSTTCSPTRPTRSTSCSFGLLIVGFAYFYTAIAFDPVQQADNLRKQGGFIPGIRPGPQTERYLAKTLSRITLPGSALHRHPGDPAGHRHRRLLLSGDSGNIGQNFGGTSLLIAVGVALETMKQIDGQLMMRNYEGFLGAK